MNGNLGAGFAFSSGVILEDTMAELRDSYAPKERGFGGKLGSRKTVWLTIVLSASLIAVGAFYLLPQFW